MYTYYFVRARTICAINKKQLKMGIHMKKTLLALTIAAGLGASCAGMSNGSNGALAGQALGHDTKATLIGAGVGTAVGYGVGNEIDKNRRRNY